MPTTNILVLGLGTYVFGKERRVVSTLAHMSGVRPYFVISKWEDQTVSRLLKDHQFEFSSAPFGYLGRAKPVWTLVTLLHIPQLHYRVIQICLQRKCSTILMVSIHPLINAFIPILFLWYFLRVRLVFYLGDTPRGGKIDRLLGWLINSMAETVIANSRAVRQGLLNIGIEEHKIQVIYNGKDLHRFETASPIRFRQRYGWNQHATLVGFVGQLSPNKGVEDFIKAAEIIIGKEARCYFLLIGGSTPLFQYFEDEMRELVGRNGLSKRVVFTGRLDDIENAYADIDLVVVPSRHEDPAPNVNIEAMASGIPVVATRVGGTPEIVVDGETGFLVEKESPERLAECILRLVRDRELRAKMGRAGRERARQMFDIRKNACLVKKVLLNA